jgi:hypothetical protein
MIAWNRDHDRSESVITIVRNPHADGVYVRTQKVDASFDIKSSLALPRWWNVDGD